MNVQGHCESKLSNDDIAQYYSLFFLPAAQRRAAMALYAFWLELREINYECAEPAVARVKLAWWYDELNEMYRGRPRHPITQALAPIVARYALPEQEFVALLTALEQHAAAASYPTYDTLRKHAERTRGRVDSLAARIDGRCGAEPPAPVTDLGAILELVALLQDIGVDARRGRVYFPRADLTRFGVDVNDLRGGDYGESARALVKHWADHLRDELAQYGTKPSAYGQLSLLSSRIAAAMALPLLAKLSARPEWVGRERPQLMPLRLLWIAWRTARHEHPSAAP